MARTFVLGDIHGAHRALVQCLQRADYDYQRDHLIALGDVADGWPDTKLCIDELLKIKHLDYIFGNHDYWTLEWMQHGEINDIWYSQGGKATIDSYHHGIPSSHIEFLERAKPCLLLNNKVFVHAGIDPQLPLENQSWETLLWDRQLAHTAMTIFQSGEYAKLTMFENIYIGHTPVTGNKPLKACDVWLMDTGAGWSGVLSMMNIDTEEIFCSDPVPSLYPGVEGRKKKS